MKLTVNVLEARDAGDEDLCGVDGEELGEGAGVGGAVRELAHHQHRVSQADRGDTHLALQAQQQTNIYKRSSESKVILKMIS